MAILQPAIRFSVLVLFLLSAVVLGSQHSTKAQTPLELEAVAQVVYPPTEDRGAPSRTKGSGSRDGCGEYVASSETAKLTALTPVNNITTTVDPHPTLYFYVPSVQQAQAELTIYDWTNRVRTPVYQTQLSLKQTPGIVKVTIPETVELKSDQIYAWNFSIYCGSNSAQIDQYVDGWLERVTLSAQQQTQLQHLQQQPLAIAQLYAEAGVWSNALDILAQMRSANPEMWRGFLASVGLNHLEEYPVRDVAEH